MRAMKITALAPVVSVLALVGCGDAGEPHEGVSELSYAPKPFYDDLDRMHVSFTTTGPARPGFEYEVILSMKGPEVDVLECGAFAFSDNPKSAVRRQTIVGEKGHTYTVTFKPSLISDADYFCHGRATLAVVSVAIRNPSRKTSRKMKTPSFRVLGAP